MFWIVRLIGVQFVQQRAFTVDQADVHGYYSKPLACVEQLKEGS